MTNNSHGENTASKSDLTPEIGRLTHNIDALTAERTSREKTAGDWDRWNIRAIVVAAIGAGLVGLSAICLVITSIGVSRANARVSEVTRRLEHSEADRLALLADSANARTGKLENDNLTLRSQVATLETQAADAKMQQAIAEKELAEVRRRQEPRGVPVALLESILKSVPPPPPGKVLIEYTEGNPETSAFTNTLWQLVLAPLWNVPKPKGTLVPSSPSGSTLGNSEITLVMPDLNNEPAYGKALWDAIRAMRVRWPGAVRDEKLPSGTVLILIGPRI